jgi:hypothetical protein
MAELACLVGDVGIKFLAATNNPGKFPAMEPMALTERTS